MQIYGSSIILYPGYPVGALDHKKVLNNSSCKGLLLEIWKPEDLSDSLKTQKPTQTPVNKGLFTAADWTLAIFRRSLPLGLKDRPA